MPSLPPYLFYLLAMAISFAISLYTVRKTISITRRMKVYDVPDKIRKIHGDGIPSLGGIGIFTGYIIVAVFFLPQLPYFMPAILSSSVLLFFAGIYDDLANMKPSGKLIVQAIVSLIGVYFAHITAAPLLAAFGAGHIPYWADVAVTVAGSIFFINAFNFIDGIDGLACVLALLYLGVLGALFACCGLQVLAGVTLALAGAAAGLLFFNIAPARIYMGDTGSLFLGFTIFNFTLLFTKWCATGGIMPQAAGIHSPAQAATVAVAMLFLPVYDGIRVFVIRLSRGISPLKADRTHLHYYLLDAGCSHSQAVAVIAGTNMLLIAIAWLLRDMNPWLVLLAVAAAMSAVVLVIYWLRQRRSPGL